jgi:membrane peptidoglycan carboxypeptidase
LILTKVWQKLKHNLSDIYFDYLSSVKHEIPPIVVITLIAGEDHRFFQHGGIDIIAICRAIWNLLAYNKLQGASTIEQQLVRTLNKQFEKQLRRKIREVLLASLVNRVVPKEEIPGVYLSVAYFGWNMNGINQACNRLGFDLGKLSLQEAASLIARLKYPEPQFISPQRESKIAVRRQYLVDLILNKYTHILDTKEARTNAPLLGF